ncbi:hypothetical protein PVNG_02202 [Plasmodium vivax North Korean]|uniref:Uncharacterized protein n=1 Tax=Plasmodium vivax North Korean TaxID=1035514 RepID=A0A0J9TUU4_PLAVI|nr:hypothetical protein PVNG_02202 [Plasmodium vivax North Korean]
MTDDILDIAKWKIEYPFLSNVSEVYDKFNNNDYGDTGRNLYDGLCDSIIKNANENVEKYKDNCMKLMRNLEYFSTVQKFYQLTPERCNMLYNWIYNLIDENKITEYIVNKCFKEYTDYMDTIGHVPNCSKLSYENDFEEPKKMTLLHIFEYNMKVMIDFLKDQSDTDKIPLRKFICECVNIYKHMNDTYCPKQESNKKYKTTCLKLNLFKDSYKIFRNNISALNYYIPSLDNIDNEFSVKCPPEGPNQVINSERATFPDDTSRMGISRDAGDYNAALAEDFRTPHETDDSSMKKNITTTVGTVAGASSVLALLYKVNENFV